MNLNSPILEIKGIGKKTSERLEKTGVFTVLDLLHVYPRDYAVFSEAVPVDEASAGRNIAVEGVIRKRPSVRSFGKNTVTIAYLYGESRALQVNWFHMPYLRNSLQAGKHYVLIGNILEKNGRMVMEHPKVMKPEEYSELAGTLMPVYPLTEGIGQNLMRKTMRTVLDAVPPMQEYLPEGIRVRLGLCEINYAISEIHYPESEQALQTARKRISFDEFFLFLLGVQLQKKQNESAVSGLRMKKVWKTEEILDSLPYRMTESQNRVWRELESDLGSGMLMHRLIQGDVGSGKTILAFLSMILCRENGFQSALMAPTSLLAEQHYLALKKLLEKNNMNPEEAVLLTGSLKASAKRECLEKIADGKAKYVIGTHALIQEGVEYHSLALVITDEQHRFGVRQRDRLSGKGEDPHILVMSATPIPRTLALMLYGDLDLSELHEVPSCRIRIKNAVVGVSGRPAAWRLIRREAEAGHQAYVVCPLIEENEELGLENVAQYTEKLKKFYGGAVSVDMLHGRMTAAEKESRMRAFQEGKTQVLVSTTVIEVGVNVQNATVMLIENAERFGLAALHQLRGRVGRSDLQSYCVFIQGNDKEEKTERLKILCRSNDGFEIASEDLKLRGPGDLLGTRQSGLAMFRAADIYRDRDLLQDAWQSAEELLELDPELSLPQNRRIRIVLERETQNQKNE